MTTAIEQAKREMYYALSGLKGRIEINYSIKDMLSGVDGFEQSLESYLEQLRQQYEEMASTAHQRFESIQSMESVNKDLIEQLAKMTESRDMFRNLHQAATHASIGRAGQGSTSGQTSGDRASCEQPDAKTMAILWDGEGLPPVGVELEAGFACEEFENWHKGVCVAVGEDPEGREEFCVVKFGEKIAMYTDEGRRMRPIRTPEQIAEIQRSNDLNEMVGFVKDHPAGRHGANHLTQLKIQEEAIIDLYNAGYRKMEKPSCMHSFFAIGDEPMKCTFCGVGK